MRLKTLAILLRGGAGYDTEHPTRSTRVCGPIFMGAECNPGLRVKVVTWDRSVDGKAFWSLQLEVYETMQTAVTHSSFS